MDLMDLFDALKYATRLGELSWKATGEKEEFPFFKQKILLAMKGYETDYNGFKIKTVVRRASNGFREIPLIGINVKKGIKEITLVQYFYKNEFLGKQIKVEQGTVISFMIEIQNIIEKPAGDILRRELEKALKNTSPYFIN